MTDITNKLMWGYIQNGTNYAKEAAKEIERLRKQNAELVEALYDLRDEYRDRKCQFDDGWFWPKHEHTPTIERVDALLDMHRTDSAKDE